MHVRASTYMHSTKSRTTPPLHKLYACKYLYRHAQSCTVFEALKDQLLMNLRMKQLYNWNVVELVSLLNVICSYSWALSAIASCNHYTLSKLYHGWYILQIYCNMYLCIKHIVEIKHSFIKIVSRKNFIILMAAILEKSSKVCKFFLATSENWNLEVLGIPMIYVSICPSLDISTWQISGGYVMDYMCWHIFTHDRIFLPLLRLRCFVMIYLSFYSLFCSLTDPLTLTLKLSWMVTYL